MHENSLNHYITFDIKGARRYCHNPNVKNGGVLTASGISIHKINGRNFKTDSFGPGMKFNIGGSDNHETLSYVRNVSTQPDMEGKFILDDESPQHSVYGRTLSGYDTIPDHCIKNALAILSGSRPIPTYRPVWYGPDEYEEDYWAAARTARVRMSTVNSTVGEDGTVYPVWHIQKTTKCRYSPALISPNGIKAPFEYADEADRNLHNGMQLEWTCGIPNKMQAQVLLNGYNDFVAIISKHLDYTRTEFIDAVKAARILYRDGDDEMRKFADSHDTYNKEFQKRVYFHDIIWHIVRFGTPAIGNTRFVNLYKIIMPKRIGSAIECQIAQMLGENNRNGIAKYVQYNAQILVAVTDRVYDRIFSNHSMALLESGLVTNVRPVTRLSEDYLLWAPVHITNAHP